MATPKLLHLRSAVQGKLPAPSAIDVGQIGVNYNAADPFICIKDSAGNVVRLSEVHVGRTAPPSPGVGLLFVDTSAAPPAVKVYDGSVWQPVTQTIANATTALAGLMSAADKTKLDGVAAGAQANVKPDWNAAAGNAAEILNKPAAYTLPAATALALGGIKVGSNLSVVTDGTLSVPASTNAAAGALRLATDAEATTGTLETVAVNPKQLKAQALPAVTAAGDVLTLESVGAAALAALAVAPYTSVPTYDPRMQSVLAAGAMPDPIDPSQPYRDGGGRTASSNGFSFIYNGNVYTLLGVADDGTNYKGTPDTWPSTGRHASVRAPYPAPAAVITPAWKKPFTYTLPAASTSTLGGVKVGAGLTAVADGTLSADVATTARVGVVKVGTGLSVTADGTLSLTVTGGLIYKGQADPTATAPAAKDGDVYLASKGGSYHASWGGLTGTATAGEMLIYEGGAWDAVGQAATTIKPDWTAGAGTAAEILNLPRGTAALEYMRWNNTTGAWAATTILEGGQY